MSDGPVATTRPAGGRNPTPPSVPATLLLDGCYLIRYTPVESPAEVLFYEGTMRVQRVGPDGKPSPAGEARAGGDLYVRLREFRYGRDLSKWPANAISSDSQQWPNPASVPAPTAGIPIFPRCDYQYYLEVLKILEDVPVAGSVTVRFGVHAFDAKSEWPNPGIRSFNLVRTDPPADQEYPMPQGSTKPLYFSGNALNENSGQIIGTVTMGWVSPHLRNARVVIDKLEGVESPGGLPEWQNAFRDAGWEIQVNERCCEVTGRASNPKLWTIGDLHHALLLARRAPLNQESIKLDLSGAMTPEPTAPDRLDLIDLEWRYHLLCVPLIDGFDRGVMFDTYGSDSNNVPREGAAVAGEWQFREFKEDGGRKLEDTKLEERWGSALGKRLEDVPDAYLRVAVHEIGHAMGLDHNLQDNGFMNTTDAIAEDGLDKSRLAQKEAEAAKAEADYAEALKWGARGAAATLGSADAKQATKAAESVEKISQVARVRAEKAAAVARQEIFPDSLATALHFQANDLTRLRFGPDVTIRPGTTFDNSGPLFADAEITRTQDFKLKVFPLLDSVPLGAPVRIRMNLENTSSQDQKAPRSLSLKTGQVDGRVVDPEGNERTFWPINRCGDVEQYITLAPNESSSHGITLLRGAQKALFPMEGVHRVRVRAVWERNGERMFAEDETDVRVSAPVDEAHRAAALYVISTPDTLLSLAIGGEHLKEGNAAITAAVNNPILRPHFAIVQVKRLLTSNPGGPLASDNPRSRIDAAAELIDGTTILSLNEIDRILDLIDTEYGRRAARLVAPEAKAMMAVLAKKIDDHPRDGAADSSRARAMNGRLKQFVDDNLS